MYARKIVNGGATVVIKMSNIIHNVLHIVL